MMFWTCLIALLLLVLLYFFTRKDGKRKLVQKTKGKPNEPIEFRLQNLQFPPLVGWPLYLMTCILNWRFISFFNDILVAKIKRNSNLNLLNESTIPDSPTYFPQVFPSKKQEEHQAPDFEALLTEKSQRKGFLFLSITELVEAYRNGETTPLQVTENALEAIQKSEKLERKLRAFVQFNKADALLMAQESTKRYAEKKTLSIIDGVPVGIKEELDVAGYHRRCGTAFLGEAVEEKDCNLVRKLRELGAVILGVTNMHELGFGTIGNNPNSFHGTARNPYNLDYHTGGSSSGSASAVAAGICPVAIGKDGGGSIRIPAAICGVVGIKPTYARITAHTHKSLGGLTVAHVGPICNNVRDTALMYALLSGRDIDYFPGLIQPEHATLEGFENTDLSDMRVGVDWAFVESANKEAVDHFRKVVELIGSQGATISSIQIPELEECRVAHILTIGTELSLGVKHVFPDQETDLNPDTFLKTKINETHTSIDYILAQKQRTRMIEFMKSIFSEVDCILTPAIACVSPKIPEASLKYGMSDVSVTGKLMRYSFLGNMTGIPGVVVPVGYGSNDLPVAVQVMTSWWEEHVALRVAHSLEALVSRKEPKIYYNILDPSKSI